MALNKGSYKNNKNLNAGEGGEGGRGGGGGGSSTLKYSPSQVKEVTNHHPHTPPLCFVVSFRSKSFASLESKVGFCNITNTPGTLW